MHQLESLSFEEWVSFVFDHPVAVTEREWYWDADSDWWAGPAAVTLDYVSRAFEDAAAVMAPWPARQRCLRSMQQLYKQVFARRCSATLGHLDEQPANPLNSVCYMWWDILPVAGRPADPGRRAFDQECLKVMAALLDLDSDACQESALHGLGHWALAYPQPVSELVDAYLEAAPPKCNALRHYALAARRGNVL